MRFFPSSLLSLSACFLVSIGTGCSRNEGGDISQTAPSAAAQAPASTAPEEASDGFDVSRYPVSSISLGDFPYVALPDGYIEADASTVERDVAPMWTGKEFQWVDGSIHQAAIFADTGHSFSQVEIDDYVVTALESIGAVKVVETPRLSAPEAQLHGLTDSLRTKYRAGLGHFYAFPSATWLVRRADGDVWVYYNSSERSAHWIIARSATYDPTIRLLSGVELRRLIEADGKAIIHVNFSSGDSAVSDTSMPQIEQVALMLRNDPDLQLSIEGHTDDTGSQSRNEALSIARAEAVRDALRAHAIDADRIVAIGHGASKPVADNDSEEGRARNRRVELVRR